MKYALPFLSLPVLFAGLAQAQGVSAPWDISQTLGALIEQSERLSPLLSQLTPQQWEAKGAPAAYTTQWRNAQNEVGYLISAAKATQKQPEKLTLALETLPSLILHEPNWDVTKSARHWAPIDLPNGRPMLSRGVVKLKLRPGRPQTR